MLSLSSISEGERVRARASNVWDGMPLEGGCWVLASLGDSCCWGRWRGGDLLVLPRPRSLILQISPPGPTWKPPALSGAQDRPGHVPACSGRDMPREPKDTVQHVPRTPFTFTMSNGTGRESVRLAVRKNEKALPCVLFFRQKLRGDGRLQVESYFGGSATSEGSLLCSRKDLCFPFHSCRHRNH